MFYFLELDGQSTFKNYPFQSRIGYINNTLPKPFSKQTDGTDIKIMPPKTENLIPQKDLMNGRTTYLSIPSYDWRPISIISKFSSSTNTFIRTDNGQDEFCSSCHRKILDKGYNLENNPNGDSIVICANCYGIWYPPDENIDNYNKNENLNRPTKNSNTRINLIEPPNVKSLGLAEFPLFTNTNIKNEYTKDLNEYNNLEDEFVADNGFDLEKKEQNHPISKPQQNRAQTEPIDSNETKIELNEYKMVVRRKKSLNTRSPIKRQSYIL